MYLCIQLFNYLNIYLYIYTYLSIPLFMFQSIYLSIYLLIYLFIYLCMSIYLSVCLLECLFLSFIYLFSCLSIYVFKYLPIDPSICLFIYLSTFNYINGTDEYVCDFMRNVIWRLLTRNYVAENPSESEKKNLLSELELMKQLKPHPYVIKLLGCVTKSGKYWNVYYQLETLLFSHPEFRTLLEVKVTLG